MGLKKKVKKTKKPASTRQRAGAKKVPDCETLDVALTMAVRSYTDRRPPEEVISRATEFYDFICTSGNVGAAETALWAAISNIKTYPPLTKSLVTWAEEYLVFLTTGGI